MQISHRMTRCFRAQLSPEIREQKQLLQHQDNTGREIITALHIAAFLGWPPLVIELIENHNQPLDIDCLDPDDKTPLMIAARGKHWDVVSSLLKIEQLSTL